MKRRYIVTFDADLLVEHVRRMNPGATVEMSDHVVPSGPIFAHMLNMTLPTPAWTVEEIEEVPDAPPGAPPIPPP